MKMAGKLKAKVGVTNEAISPTSSFIIPSTTSINKPGTKNQDRIRAKSFS